MILLDCGNSSIKAQYRYDGELRASFSSAYDEAWPQRLQRWMQNSQARRCYLSSVLDSERQARLQSVLERHFADAVTRYRSEASRFGIVNAYEQPERLGADRWMALLAAAEMVEGDCIVIDAGSAITVDLLRADGQHLGGAILPGFNTSVETFKRIFSHIDFDDPAIGKTEAPGCSTEAAIQLNYGHHVDQGLPDLVKRWRESHMAQAELLLAGGDAGRVLSLLATNSRIIPDIVFRGIYRLASQ